MLTNFDESSKTWDTDKRINRAKIIAAEICDSVKAGKTLKAMEYGCGTGLVSFNEGKKINYSLFLMKARVAKPKPTVDV